MSTVALSAEGHKELFTERVLPTVEHYADFFFRYLRRRKDDLADAIADCVAHAWEGYVFAVRLGKEPWLFPSALATFAARKTRMGRKVGKRVRSKDVFNAARVGRIELDHIHDEDHWQKALADNMQTPVPDQAAFRLDFPAWLGTLSERNRRIAKLLASGYSGKDVARRFHVSRTRVTQIRQRFQELWERFTA